MGLSGTNVGLSPKRITPDRQRSVEVGVRTNLDQKIININLNKQGTTKLPAIK